MELEKYYACFLVKKNCILNYKKTIFFALKANKKYSFFIFDKVYIFRNRDPPFINLVKN